MELKKTVNTRIILDFDATCVFHRFPEIGEDIPHCVETLKKWQENYGVVYILSTMRNGKYLDDAVKWFEERNIPLYGIQKEPTQERWTDSPKCHGDFCIDDRNIPNYLKTDELGIPFIDWETMDEQITPMLKERCKNER